MYLPGRGGRPYGLIFSPLYRALFYQAVCRRPYAVGRMPYDVGSRPYVGPTAYSTSIVYRAMFFFDVLNI